MIVDKYIEIMTVGKSIKHYKELGYECGYRTTILVKQVDLSLHSNIKIDIICDYCGKEFQATMSDINRETIIKKHCCKECSKLKVQEGCLDKYGYKSPACTAEFKEKVKNTIYDKYGVENIFQVEEFKEKQINTIRNKYGCDNVFQNEQIKNKIKTTILEKYGVTNPMKCEEIRDKSKETCLNLYGFESPLQNEEVKEKIKNTMIKRYGVEIPLQNSEINKKQKQTMLDKYGVEYATQDDIFLLKSLEKGKITNLSKYGVEYVFSNKEISEKAIKNSFISRVNNNSFPSSKNQDYLCELYGGILNDFFDPYLVDVYFDNEKIYLEYDGSGHDLCVKLGSKSLKKFNISQIIRYKTLKNKGLKYFRIIHTHKKLPNDNVLLSIKKIAFQFLLTTNNSWISFNLDKNEIETKSRTIIYSNDFNGVIEKLITL